MFWLVVVVVTAFGAGISPIVRRLHDLGFSGWFAVIGLIPYLGQILWIALFVVPGNNRPNKYGPQPQIVGVAAISPGSQK
ncbi:MAG: DUF805 domain-containing protein [Planctomycetes bacterium]|nr:DUF805 domain-containing protein [Planctomycetota bacterium]